MHILSLFASFHVLSNVYLAKSLNITLSIFVVLTFFISNEEMNVVYPIPFAYGFAVPRFIVIALSSYDTSVVKGKTAVYPLRHLIDI